MGDNMIQILARDYSQAAAWSFTSPSGGLWPWLRLARVPGDALAARAASAGLAGLPGSALFADGAPGNYVRVPFTGPARDPQQGGGPPHGRPRQFGIEVRLAVRLS